MQTDARLALAAVPFFWCGLVIAISFLEAPLKFRAPGITIPLGLGIGRLVFRALNRTEIALFIVALSACGIAWSGSGMLPGVLGALGAVLLAQTLWLRPVLDARATRLLSGETLPRTWHHAAYAGLEAVKVLLLFSAGIAALRQLIP